MVCGLCLRIRQVVGVCAEISQELKGSGHVSANYLGATADRNGVLQVLGMNNLQPVGLVADIMLGYLRGYIAVVPLPDSPGLLGAFYKGGAVIKPVRVGQLLSQ